MKIIVGLGNVGAKYLKNRHNVGFLVLDQFVADLEKGGTEVKWKEESKFKAFLAKIQHKGEDTLLVKPTTFMNNSGQAVSSLVNFYKIDPAKDLLVIYDDIDLPLGTIRERESGSAGTHNGMKSIIAELGTDNFPRIRIGIESRGEMTPTQQDLSNFVLSDFTQKEISLIAKAVKEVAEKLSQLLH